MTRFLCACIAVAAFGAPALAQTPAAPGSASPAGATTTIDQEKRGAAAEPATQRSASTRPGATPLPMNIKIQGEGIKLPPCTAESREGEACKK
jgi:hypothetical protein